jgi:hypothetical protein
LPAKAASLAQQYAKTIAIKAPTRRIEIPANPVAKSYHLAITRQATSVAIVIDLTLGINAATKPRSSK